MKRSRFLILALATSFVANAAPRLAAAAVGGRVRFVQRYAHASVPGRCANHRLALRWAGFTAADFDARVRRRG